MPSKRPSASGPSSRRVRRKAAGHDFLEATSAEERAEPYRLMTAKFHIDDLTATWSIGSNREVDRKHVRQLCGLYEEHGVQRQDRSHRVRLLCRADDVRIMCEHLGISSTPNDTGTEPPFFHGWTVATSSPAEMLTGKHRIEALDLYLERRKITDRRQRWWTCDILDKDRLPLELQIELRANRSGTVLPDTHGQIWNEIVTYTEQDTSGTVFRGIREEVEAHMSRALRLNGREQFPVRRLAILWKNTRWSAYITGLCGTKVGKEMFNISIFQQLASYRIDDFIFERIDAMLEPVRRIQRDLSIELDLHGYQKLANVGTPRQPRELFYPKCCDSVDVDKSSPRRADLLTHLDDTAYHALYTYLVEYGDGMSFPSVTEMLKSTNAYGKTMQIVLTHVVMWLNNDPAQVNDRDSNKPPLVDDLLPVASAIVAPTNTDHDASGRTKALHLQRIVLTYVEEQATSFTEHDHKPYLDLLPRSTVDPDAYRERFRTDAWRGLLIRVQQMVGNRFPNPCLADFRVETFDDPAALRQINLANSLHEAIVRCPDITRHSTLSNLRATEMLREMVEATVARWVAECCRAVSPDSPSGLAMLEESMLRSDVARFRNEYRARIDKTPSRIPRPVATTERERSPPREQPSVQEIGGGNDMISFDDIEDAVPARSPSSMSANTPVVPEPARNLSSDSVNGPRHAQDSREHSTFWDPSSDSVSMARKACQTEHRLASIANRSGRTVSSHPPPSPGSLAELPPIAAPRKMVRLKGGWRAQPMAST